MVYNSKSGAQCARWCTIASWMYKVMQKCPSGGPDRQIESDANAWWAKK